MKLIARKGSTFHDFPYSHPERKCLHCWIVNVTPPGPKQCLHDCIYCYAKEAIYSHYCEDTLIYGNLPELVEKDLRKLALCPPILLSTISDPCQDIPELRREVRRLIQLLMDYGVSFFITTKGDPSFLLELPDFAQYTPKFIATTIEGTAEVLGFLSPKAPPLDARVSAVGKLSAGGIDTVIRFDPVFLHLLCAIHGDAWLKRVDALFHVFASIGVKHIIAGTGRLSKRRAPLAGHEGTSTWQRVYRAIYSQSPLAARRFEQEYVYEAHWSGGGYRLRRDLRLRFHHQMKELVEATGMTYASCQEASAAESDSPGIPHCEGLPIPFARKQTNGRFKSIPACTANCHVSCQKSSNPNCGQAALISSAPLRLKQLCFVPKNPGRADGEMPTA